MKPSSNPPSKKQKTLFAVAGLAAFLGGVAVMSGGQTTFNQALKAEFDEIDASGVLIGPQMETNGVKGSGSRRGKRDLSIDLGDGDCLLTAAAPLGGPGFRETMWLTGPPGVGKRLSTYFIEALTGVGVTDDYDYTERGVWQHSAIKGMHPTYEGILAKDKGWYQATHLTVLQLRNPRWSIPSALSLRSELGMSFTTEAVKSNMGKVYNKRASIQEWEEHLTTKVLWVEPGPYHPDLVTTIFNKDVKSWGRLIDHYMENGLVRTLQHNQINCEVNGGHCYDFRCKSAQWPDAKLDCFPKAVVSYERLTDVETGADEMTKIAEVLQTQAGLTVINSTTWPCIYDAVMKTSPNKKRNGKGPPEKSYQVNSTHLYMIHNETKRIIEKYSEPEWSDDPIALELVDLVQGYEDENAAELASVLTTEHNCNPNPCQNGATCEVGLSRYFYYYSFRCLCPPGWKGQFCEVVDAEA